MLSEDQLFEIKGKFLQQIPHPKLIQKQIDRLRDYKLNYIQQSNIELDEDANLSVFLEQYISNTLALKLEIANSKEGKILFLSLVNLKELQERLIKKLSSYFPENSDAEDTDIKLSDPIDVYAYLKELQAEKINESEIKNYLCAQFEKGPKEYSVFTQGILRARKIEGHG